MKKIILATVAAILTVCTAHADDSAYIGVEVIARNVIEKKLVNKDARDVLAFVLETGRGSFGPMECDRATGKDLCVFDVFIHDDETTDDPEETLYRLNVIIREGNISSAEFHMIAG